MDGSPEERPKRSRRETSYKAKAFEKFKDLKSGKRKKYEIDEIDNVYEIVEEKEYVKTVLQRHDDDWIVDDDGSGYVEDGRDIFDDDLDSESIAQVTSKGKEAKRRKKNVSENAGKGNLQMMLSNMPTKKKNEVTKIDEDEMLSEILGEIDETDNSDAIKPKPMVNEYSAFSRKLAANNYMKNFTPPAKISLKKSNVNKEKLRNRILPKPVLKEAQNSADEIKNDLKNDKFNSPKEMIKEHDKINSTDDNMFDSLPTDQSESQLIPDASVQNSNTNHSSVENELTEDFFDDDIDMSLIEEPQSQQETSIDEEKLADEIESEFMTKWENLSNETINTETKNFEETDIPVVESENKKVFRFFWWDAYENPEKQKGVVFLFGKTYCEKAKGYVSCCVAVRNISRRIYFLPRPYVLGDDDKPTEEAVDRRQLYNEIHDIVIKPLHIGDFRTKMVHKKYCFDPTVPAESDYMELRYPATDPRIDLSTLDTTPKTFSRIFGANTSYLELLLIERKIKGPCWLDVNNPIPVSNPLSWCKFEINCMRANDLSVATTQNPLPPPPLVVACINMRTSINPKNLRNEILMISCLVHKKYAVDKQQPNPPFEQHFCVVTGPSKHILSLNMHNALKNYKATRVQKVDSENALLNCFLTQFASIDPDLVVGHDLQGYQINVLADRLVENNNKHFSKFGRLKRSEKKKLEHSLFLGRLVCDIKVSAKELIKSRSYDLDTLCQVVLKLKENQRIELEPEDVPKMYQSCNNLLKLVSFTMQDTSYILKMMYDLNIIPLALQITNIAGNVMSKTLLGGRSERNEFLLLHAFSNKDYIVPDKQYKKKDVDNKTSSRKKPTYAGGLVLDPKIGFYDKFILLMDFNSLYPSIIQEYNICFTTLPITNTEDNIVLPGSGLPPGILPTEIRKLVESRRQVKSLMSTPDISNDLRMQYNIRQMALKLTANSMYGCLGFSNSRFYAKNLAALVTHKGREILTSTKYLVEKTGFEVVYGDTDSIMINTNIDDYDQVFKIGLKIKQEVNKLYKQVELDIDGVFKSLLLLKKKKYAAITLSKTKDGKLKTTPEYKGLDIVRRDWSQLACETGKYILEIIFSEQPLEERIISIQNYLGKIREDLENGKVPISLLVITKQLTKDPKMYTDKNKLPHVQVAIRYNQKSGGHFRSGDTVPYVICEDGTSNSAVQRAYHLEELKNSETLKIDVKYYLAQQIHPIVMRICEPIDGIDAFQIAECLGLDTTSFKKPMVRSVEPAADNILRPEVKFINAQPFKFKCYTCAKENVINSALIGNIPFLSKCANLECNVKPVEYLPYIQNQLTLAMQHYVRKYYECVLICEDPGCPNETSRIPLKFVKKYPVCTVCHKAVMYKVYTEELLYTQLIYFKYLFDLSKFEKKPFMQEEIESGFHILRETVEKFLKHSGYSLISLGEIFQFLAGNTKEVNSVQEENDDEILEEDEEDFD